MHCGVACRAQRDQVFLGIGSRMAAEFPVVDLKIGSGTTTAPLLRQRIPTARRCIAVLCEAALPRLWNEIVPGGPPSPSS